MATERAPCENSDCDRPVLFDGTQSFRKDSEGKFWHLECVPEDTEN